MTIPMPSSDLRSVLFDEIPSGIVVLDRSLKVVDHNRSFESIFGESRGMSCYRATKGRDEQCAQCPALETFVDGRQRVIEATGTDRNGHTVHYLMHITPVQDRDGETFVAATTVDVTSSTKLQQEYQTLFEKVPCFVAVINRDHRVVKANEAFRRVFGDPTGEPCYRLYKRRRRACPDCPVDRTFRDGGSYSEHQDGVDRKGRPTPYLVFTAPLLRDGDSGEVTHVIEMALDFTEHRKLEDQLCRADVMRSALVENTPQAILVLDEQQKVMLVNTATEDLLGESRAQLLQRRPKAGLLPPIVRKVLSGKRDRVVMHEETLTKGDGTEIPVRLTAIALRSEGAFMGSAVSIEDLSAIRRLEHEKLEAERLAAVGQTVAGLAHGIKNIITGLEGGMYVMSSGLKRGDADRLQQGWEMLERNVGRISELSRSLLAFSRGERLSISRMDPARVILDVVELYRESAAHHGVEIRAEIQEGIGPAMMDPEGLHSALANLIANAVDACLMSDQPGSSIAVGLTEQDDVLRFEVRDTGCGMDCEVKQKAFTSFFTTKGKGGSGLGLLLTRKIVVQHGGSIEFSSEPGTGTTFVLVFPRERLPQLEKESGNGHQKRQ